MSPVWISIIIGLVSVIFAAGVAWGIVKTQIRSVQDAQGELKASQAVFSESIDSLKDTIREEFDRAISRINSLLFNADDSMPRYTPRKECRDFRAEIEKRITRLEGR
jgi:uncharacterized membrane-anchored protein YhcB (DUF1043 family)